MIGVKSKEKVRQKELAEHYLHSIQLLLCPQRSVITGHIRRKLRWDARMLARIAFESNPQLRSEL